MLKSAVCVHQRIALYKRYLLLVCTVYFTAVHLEHLPTIMEQNILGTKLHRHFKM